MTPLHLAANFATAPNGPGGFPSLRVTECKPEETPASRNPQTLFDQIDLPGIDWGHSIRELDLRQFAESATAGPDDAEQTHCEPGEGRYGLSQLATICRASRGEFNSSPRGACSASPLSDVMMRLDSVLTESRIQRDSVRFSCDIPGLGRTVISVRALPGRTILVQLHPCEHVLTQDSEVSLAALADLATTLGSNVKNLRVQCELYCYTWCNNADDDELGDTLE